MKLMNLIFLIAFLGMLNFSAAWGQCGGAITATITSSVDVGCFGGATGTATVAATGGNGGPYTFLWDASASGQTIATATGLTAGTYFVTATDPSGPCQDVTSVTINQPATALSVSATVSSNYNGSEVSCHGAADGEAVATASGGTVSSNYGYLWSLSGVTETTVTGLSDGSYSVTVTDDNGCTASSSVTVTNPSAITATIVSQVNIVCHGYATGEATATGSGGAGMFTYLWDINAGSQTTATATALTAGNYTVTVADANGCTAITSTVISQHATAISASAMQTGAVNCNGSGDGEATASAVGGTVATSYTYLWTVNSQTTATATGLQAGVHSVSVWDDNGCIDNASVTITAPTAVSATIASQVNVDCFGDAVGQATVVGSGGNGGPYLFQWDANTGNQITATATGLPAGTYSVTVTDISGNCTGMTNTTINQPVTAVSVSAAVTSNYNGAEVSCHGAADGVATVTANGGTVSGNYIYTWSSGSIGDTLFAIGAGSYGVTVTDDNGCTASSSVTVTEPSAITLTMDSTDVSCNGLADGTVSVAVSGGTLTSNYTYLWNDLNASTSSFAVGLAADVYEVTVTDDNLCQKIGTISIIEPNALTVFLVSTTAVTCKGGLDGELVVSSTGGLPGYDYQWMNGQTATTATGLAEGIYDVTVTDQNGCQDTVLGVVGVLHDAYINQPMLLGGGSHPQMYTGDSYNIDGVALDPTNMTYAWTPALGLSCTNCLDPIASPLVTTTYYFTATHNTASCIFEDSITIEVYPNDPTDTIHIGLEPDSITNACVTLPAFISGTQGAFGHMGSSLSGSFFAPLYGCYQYTAGSVPNVVDTLILVACEQLCDTTIVIVTTGTCVWAGDANDDQVANNLDLLPIGLHYGATGYSRPNADLSYTCQPSRDWGQGITGQLATDIKHIDTDGNSIINDDDTLAISQNWGQIHLRGGHGFMAGPPMFVDTLLANPSDTLHLPVMLGDLANVVTGAYGIAFTINYDSTNIKAGSTSLSFDNSWMGNGLNTISIQKDFHALGRIEAALTRIDQTPITGAGQIGTLHLTIKDVVLPNRSWGGAVRLDFEVTNVVLIDNVGNYLPVDPMLTQVLVLDPATGALQLETAKEEVSIRPNPASSYLDINTNSEQIEKVGIYTLDGRLVLEKMGNSAQLNLDLGGLTNGLYILSVQTEKEVHTKQLIIQK